MPFAKRLLPRLCAALVFLSVSCTRNAAGPDPAADPSAWRESTTPEKRLVECSNDFGLNLFRQMSGEETGQNLFISPLSVSMALGMAMDGAAGATRDSMEKTLELEGFTASEINGIYQNHIGFLTQADPRVQMEIANSIWYRNTLSFKTEFFQVCSTYFHALISGLDFSDPASVGTINQWVNDKTHGKIPEVIQGIDPATVMFLINAMYFKGAWTSTFDSTATREDSFYQSTGPAKTCMMMHQITPFPFYSGDGLKMAELPYGDSGFCMTVLLPDTGRDIDSFAAQMTAGNWKIWNSRLDTAKVNLYIPRFKLEYEKSLRQSLISLGMSPAFSGNADFTGMYAPGGLWITDVVHKTYLEVNEEGTTAAAVTVVIAGLSYCPTCPPEPIIQYMKINHPFIAIIWEKQSGTILFIGKIMDPA